MAPDTFKLEPDIRPGEVMARSRAVYRCEECDRIVREPGASGG
jgi:hypothetical protein